MFRNAKLVTIGIGIPVVGKGMQGSLLEVTTPNLQKHVMRDMIGQKKETDLSFRELAESYEERGDLLPCDIINGLVDELITPPKVPGSVLWLDGGGRTRLQLHHLRKRLQGIRSNNIRVAHFQMDPDEAERRFIETLGAPDRSKRLDGEIALHKKRTAEHLEREPELLAMCRSFGWVVATIRADNTPFHVHKDMRQKLNLGKLTEDQARDAKQYIAERQRRVVVPAEFRPSSHPVLLEA